MSKSPEVVMVHADSVEKRLMERLEALEPGNADVIFKDIMFRYPSDEAVEKQLSNKDAFEDMVKSLAEKIRGMDFVPEWPISVEGKTYSLNKGGQFVLPDECVDYLQEQVKKEEPEEYDQVLDFILSQCPLYVADVLQSKETLHYAIEEYKEDQWRDSYRPFSVVYRSPSNNKAWWWNRWFGIGKSHSKGSRPDVEGNPPIYPGETATNYEDLDDDLTEFSRSAHEKVLKKFPPEIADRVVGMLLNFPAEQRSNMLDNEELLLKKAEKCHNLLQPK